MGLDIYFYKLRKPSFSEIDFTKEPELLDQYRRTEEPTEEIMPYCVPAKWYERTFDDFGAINYMRKKLHQKELTKEQIKYQVWTWENDIPAITFEIDGEPEQTIAITEEITNLFEHENLVEGYAYYDSEIGYFRKHWPLFDYLTADYYGDPNCVLIPVTVEQLQCFIDEKIEDDREYGYSLEETKNKLEEVMSYEQDIFVWGWY